MRKSLIVATAVVLVGCATIMHGTGQDIAISSQPTAAAVSIDNKAIGLTPVTTHLSRKDLHTITISMAGYQPFQMNLTRHVSGWVWGNIVFGGLIGLAVDAMSGGLYELTPSQVTGQLQAQQKVGSVMHRGALTVFLVASPGTNWQRIGTLRR